MVDNKFLPKLSQNLLEILEDDDYYDITIEVGKDPFVKVFRSHMAILYYRSPYFRRILSTNKRKNDGNLVHIKLQNILPEIFQIILRYIYGGELSLETHETSDIIKILEAAGELGLEELITYLQTYLIENKANWMEQNFNLVNQTSFGHDSFLNLQKFCTDLMSKDPDKIFKSLDFVSIPEKSLVSLVQNDNLLLSEVQLWEYVLKWSFAQNPELSSDPSNYSKDDLNTLKCTLRHCIPFIRFHNLTYKEFLDKVYPYKKVLPKELREDLIKYFLDFDNKYNKLSDESRPRGVKIISANIDSKIISNKHVELISRWINKVDASEKLYTSYEFKLMFRRSRDEWLRALQFHNVCDNQPCTGSIFKVKDSNEILGGYNPIEWKSSIFGSYGITNDSFIFSFKDKENIDNYILSRVNDEKYAIYNKAAYGPSFGYSDLITTNMVGIGANYCKKRNYEKQIRETNSCFYIEEYEVFQIIHT